MLKSLKKIAKGCCAAIVFLALIIVVRAGYCQPVQASFDIGLTPEEKAFLVDHTPIRIGIMNNWPPLDYVDKNGQPAGIGVGYFEALNKRLGYRLVIEPAPFNENYDKVKKRQLDALMDITPKPDREPFFEFTRPYLTIPHVIVGRENGPYFSSEKELKGKTVALEKGYYNVVYFRQNYPEVRVVEYASTSDALDAVARGEVDAYAGNRAVAIYLIEKELISNLQLQGRLGIPPSELTIGVRKDWPILADILDKALRAIPESEREAINAHYISSRYEPWFASRQFWTIIVIAVSLVALISLLSLFWNRSLKRLVDIRTQELQQLNAIVSRSPLVVFTWKNEPGWPVELVSSNVDKLLGYSPAEFLSGRLKYRKCIHPEDLERVTREVETYSKEKGREEYVHKPYRLITKNGQEITINDWTFIVRDKSGRVTQYKGIVEDITEKRHVEEALRESERKYRELVENANSIILRWRRDGRITFLNEFGQRFFGYTEQEILGRHVVGTIVPEAEEGGRDLRSLIEEIGKDPKALEQNVNENMRRNGERVWISWTNKVVMDPNGKVAEILSIGQDFTERKRAEAMELELMKVREIDKLKSMFIASMSHELRTPLNSIIGFTGIMLQGLAGALNDEQKKQLKMVKSSASHLLALINDVIDVSKIEAEKIQLSIEKFDLAATIRNIRETFKTAVEERGHRVNLDLPEKLEIRNDERRVKQIIINLVSNAVKFMSKNGSISIKAVSKGRLVEISVADTGYGIKTEDMKKLFKQFSRIFVESQPMQEGTGLGLYLSQKLARILGGEVRAESEFCKGSTFTLALPVEYEEDKNEKDTDHRG